MCVALLSDNLALQPLASEFELSRESGDDLVVASVDWRGMAVPDLLQRNSNGKLQGTSRNVVHAQSPGRLAVLQGVIQSCNAADEIG